MQLALSVLRQRSRRGYCTTRAEQKQTLRRRSRPFEAAHTQDLAVKSDEIS
jgi:hypothetical protein